MSWEQIQRNWRRLQDEAHATWGELREQDLVEIDGRRDRLVRRLQNRYGLTRELADRDVRRWQRRMERSSERRRDGLPHPPYRPPNS